MTSTDRSTTYAEGRSERRTTNTTAKAKELFEKGKLLIENLAIRNRLMSQRTKNPKLMAHAGSVVNTDTEQSFATKT